MSAAAGSHQASNRPLVAVPGRVRMYQPQGTTAAKVEAALRPLHSAIATAERAAARARLAVRPRPVPDPAGPDSQGRMLVSGKTIQGTSEIGSSSPEVWPATVSATGDSA